MRAPVLAMLALGLVIAGPAAAVSVPPVEFPVLPDVTAGCDRLVVSIQTTGVAVEPPQCQAMGNALPKPDPVGVEFPALPPLPELPELPALPELPQL